MLEQYASLGQQLQAGCDALDVSLSQQQHEHLMQYLDLLCKWNQAYNLTAVREPTAMVTRHLLDSLAVAPYLKGECALDVGTGAGLPGIALAILFPQREFHLLDSNGKKTRFLFQVKTALGLDNMVVHQARVESFTAAEHFDTVLSRAFATLRDMVHGTRHVLSEQGRFLAMKGTYPTAELAELADENLLATVYPLTVPGLDEERHLVELAFNQHPGHT